MTGFKNSLLQSRQTDTYFLSTKEEGRAGKSAVPGQLRIPSKFQARL